MIYFQPAACIRQALKSSYSHLRYQSNVPPIDKHVIHLLDGLVCERDRALVHEQIQVAVSLYKPAYDFVALLGYDLDRVVLDTVEEVLHAGVKIIKCTVTLVA